jgi:anti-sigma factor RsiW
LNCQRVFRELSNYIDGDLDPVLRVELEVHLTVCQNCCLVVDQTKKTIELFCDSELVPLPEDVRSKIHAALREKMRQKS